ncbi:retropepsin-like aspartic protease [Sphingomonas sp. H39-1-10]|uniref:retropepsin-like aspartic protease n=1 Tax=Sphingomonas pollutisoli TaxID=3030829 RepID=UPI0023B9B674|nr:retropepsin-like aspartic protease [Sphingomonas pollutisoli]MDF0490149.1 retropepsin-like aspartic protease [Sphingomonas pollutisoli]
MAAKVAKQVGTPNAIQALLRTRMKRALLLAVASTTGFFPLMTSTAAVGQDKVSPGPDKTHRQVQITYVGSTEGWAAVPFERYRNEIFFKATINGVEANVLLDNGTGSSELDTGFAVRAGLRPEGPNRGVDTGSARVPERLVKNVEMAIPHHLTASGTFMTSDLAPLAKIMGHPIDAVLGGDVLNTMAVGVITSTRSLYLMPSGKVTPNAGIAVPLINGTQVEAEVNGKPVRLYVDLGSNGIVNLSDDAWQRVIPSTSPVVKSQFTNGEGVIRTSLRSSDNTLKLGAATSTGIDIVNRGRDPRGSDGLLGGGYLGHFDVVLDVQAKKLFLIPIASR